jgi:hypothetical protein
MSLRLHAVVGSWLLLAATGGCVARTYQTRPVATLGYQRPRTAALVMVDGDPAVTAWIRDGLRATGRLTVVTESTSPASTDDPVELCRALTGASPTASAAPTWQPSPGATGLNDYERPWSSAWAPTPPRVEPGAPIAPPFPAELIVVVRAKREARSSGGIPNQCSGTLFRDDGDGCGVSGASRAATVTIRLTALSATTCGWIKDERLAASRSLNDGRDGHAALDAALQGGELAELLDRFVPQGLEVAAVHGATIELTGPSGGALRSGESYALMGRRLERRKQLGTVRVVQATADATTLFTVRPPADLRLGDQVAAFTHPHEWKLTPILTLGELTGDTRSSAVLGLGAALRWAYPRAYLQGEVLLSGQLLSEFRSQRVELGGAFGGRLPLGVVAPFVMGELGAAFLPEDAAGGQATYRLRSYQGAVAGLELWVGRYVVMLDARLRRATGVPESGTGSETYREQSLQLGVGGRI